MIEDLQDLKAVGVADRAGRATTWRGTPALTVASFAHIRFADLFKTEGVEVDRTGLPGVQDKVSAAMLSLPVARRSERYLLKLSPRP